MPDNHIHSLILGIDPGLSLKKLMAVALVDFRGDGTRHLLSRRSRRVSEHCIEDRFDDWLDELEYMLQISLKTTDRLPDMVAIEDVRAPGKGGAHLQTLITFLKERAEKHGIRVELVNPSSVKLHATGYGASSTEKVAIAVRAEYKGADKLPIVAGEYDLEMAPAIAGAGYAVLQKEALKRLADGN